MDVIDSKARNKDKQKHYDVQLEFSMVIVEIDRDLQNELQSHNYAENKIWNQDHSLLAAIDAEHGADNY